MKSIITLLYIIALSTLASCSSLPQTQPIKHHFIAVDNGIKQLVEVNQFTGTQRTFSLPIKARDISLYDENTLLLSVKNGFAFFDLQHWKMKQQILVERGIESALKLGDTEILLTQNKKKKGYLLRVNNQGEVLQRWQPENAEYLRLARNNKEQFLFTSINPFEAFLFNPKNNKLTKIPLAGKGYKLSQQGKLLYATTGETVTLDVLTKKGELVKRYGGKKEHADSRLQWFSGFALLDEQSVMVANWLGHRKNGQGPHLIQFDRNNQIVWQWEDHQLAKQITNFILLK